MNPYNAYREEIRRLDGINHGRLTPEQIVEEARNPASPLHSYPGFEWNDAKAAHANRVDAARELLGICRVEIRHSAKIVETIAYVHDPALPPKEQGYVSTVLLNTQREEALRAIMEEVKQVRARIERTRDLARGLDLVEETEERLRAALD